MFEPLLYTVNKFALKIIEYISFHFGEVVAGYATLIFRNITRECDGRFECEADDGIAFAKNILLVQVKCMYKLFYKYMALFKVLIYSDYVRFLCGL